MTRTLRAILLALLVVALAGCQSLSPWAENARSSQPDRLQSILKSGVLRVGLSGSQPPLNHRNKMGELVGLEVDLVEVLGQAMGLEIEFVEMPFAELLESLEEGEVDLVISGMTVTPERNARVAFAGPYFISGKSVLSKSDTITNVQDTSVLDDPSRTYAALAGSTSEEFVKNFFPSAQLVATRDYDTAVQMVIDDKVDALIADYPICGVSVLRYPDAGLTTLMTPFTIEPLGIALPADAPLLVNLMENYLTSIENTGILTQLKAKWFSNGSWVSELP